MVSPFKDFTLRIQSKETWDRAAWFLGRKPVEEVWGGLDNTPISEDLLPFMLSLIRMGTVVIFAMLPYSVAYLFFGHISYSLLLLLGPVFCLLFWAGFTIFDSLVNRFIVKR